MWNGGLKQNKLDFQNSDINVNGANKLCIYQLVITYIVQGSLHFTDNHYTESERFGQWDRHHFALKVHLTLMPKIS